LKKLLATVLLFLFLLIPAVFSQAAGSTVIKLATLITEGSVWGTLLKEMGADWKKATDGRVTLRMYAGGVAGDDPDAIRKMRIGQLHASTLTILGLTEIDPAFNVFTIPFFIDSYEELFFVWDELDPHLRKRLQDKGFILLHWGHAGWIHLFSTRPVTTIDEFKSFKFFVAAGDGTMVSWWKDRGFHPVPLAVTDMVQGLQTGMIEALPATPLSALYLQWYRSAPHMLDLGFAPLVGATVITERAWRKIAPEDQQALLTAGRRTEERFRTELPAQDQHAMEEMEKRGLSVTRVVGTPAEQGWRDSAEMFATTMRDDFVPPDIFDLAVRARQSFRKQRAASPD